MLLLWIVLAVAVLGVLSAALGTDSRWSGSPERDGWRS